MRERIRRWALPVALGLAVLITIGGAVIMRPRHQQAVASPVVSDRIGLAASADGDGLRLEWNRNAPKVRSANHALLYIQDGNKKSRLHITGQQLAASTVRYWPESPEVHFRLELYHGDETVADEVRVATAKSPAAPKGASRTALERARPSPFERVKADVVRRPSQVPVVAAAVREEPPPLPAAKPKESGWGKFVSRIPLLRRLKKHPQTSESP
jgi:hypothetical protein